MNVWTLFGSLSLDSSGVTRGLKESEQAASKAGAAIERDLGARLTKLQGQLQNVGQGLTLMSAPLVAFGVTAIRTAGDFEASMNRVRATTGATGESFEKLNDLAKDLGATTAFSASEAALAMNALAQAGFNVEQITSALPGVLELAAAGTLSLEEAAGIAANTLTAFGLEASEVGRVNDVLAKGAISANTNVREMAEGFKYVAPIANGLGFSFEETTAAMTQLARAGITASTSGTALRAIMTQLVTEADDLGISVKDSAGNMLPLADILAQLEVRGYTAEEAMLQFGETGGPGLTALLGLGTDSLRELEGALQNAGGTAANLAAVQMEGFNGKMAELSSAFESLQLAIANSGLIDFAEAIVVKVTEWLLAMSELNPEVLRTATVLAGIVVAIGPVLLGVAKAIQIFMGLQRAVTTIRTAMIALRVVMLGMMGPVGWVIAGVTAVGALTAAFVVNRNKNRELAEQMAATEAAAKLEAEQIATINTALTNMDSTITTVLVPINKMVVDINESSGSVTALQEAVDRAASGMSVEGAAAFRSFAAQAIASGADLKTVAAQIADRAQRTSLLAKVDELAAGMQGDGREAFINYAKEAITQSSTAQAALQAIMEAWTAVRNAGAIAAAENRVAALESQKALSEIQFTDLQLEIDATKLKLEEWRALLATKQEGDPGITGLRESITLFENTQRELEAASATLEAGIGQFSNEITTLQANIGTLRGETVDFTTTTVTLVDSGVKPLTGAVGGLATATSDAGTAAKETKTEFERAMEAAAEAARRADAVLQDLAVAEEARRRAVEAGGAEAIAQTTAQSDALQAQANAAIAFANESLTALQAVIDGVETFEYDQTAISSGIESAMADADSISAELTRQTELLAAEIAASNAALARLVDERVAESDRLAAEIIGDTSANVVAGAKLVGEEVEGIVTGIENTTGATIEFFETTVAKTNELIDDVITGNETLRDTIEANNKANAEATLPNYADGIESTMELAAATAGLTQRKYELGLVTRDELIASFDAYAASIQAEMNFIGEENAAYVALAEKLREVVALKRELTGVGATGAGMPTGITTGISAVLNELANRIRTVEPSLTNFAARLLDAGASIASFVGSILSQVPVFEAVISGFSVQMDNTTGQVSASVDAFAILTGILSAVIGSSTSFQALIEDVNTALKPFIETVGNALVNALTPLLTVAVQLLNALAPIIEVALALVQTALMPLVWILQNVFTPVITFVANIIRAIWNGIATALNAILGVFGVRIPLIGGPGSGDAGGGAGGGGGGGGGGGTDEPKMQGEILRSNGVIITRGEDGRIAVSYGTGAAPAGSIQRERDTIAALNQALNISTDPKERTQIRNLIQKHQDILEAAERDPIGLPKEPPPPPPPGEPERQPGMLEKLEAERRAWQKKLSEATTEAEIADANQNLARIDAEINRLRAIGQPAGEEPQQPTGKLAELEAQRREWQKRLEAATTDQEITLANQNLARIDQEIRRLRGLGTTPPTRTPRPPRQPTAPAPTPTTPTTPPPVTPPTPTPERPVVFDEQALNFATVTQSVQFAVATPIVEASIRMLEAARTLAGIGGDTGLFAPIPPFTQALERLTPLLDRLILEGVSINVNSTSRSTGMSLANALRPL